MSEVEKSRFVRSLLAIAICVGLSGCASAAREGSMATSGTTIPQGQVPSSTYSVTQVTGGSETNPLFRSNISDSAFQAALIESMGRLGIYDPASSLQVTAEIQDVRQPFLGLNLRVEMAVRYTVTDGNGEVVYSSVIDDGYTAAFGDHLIGSERLRLANEGAARVNIQAFLEGLLAAGIEEAAA